LLLSRQNQRFASSHSFSFWIISSFLMASVGLRSDFPRLFFLSIFLFFLLLLSSVSSSMLHQVH
jgi:hypothetical protein